MCSTTGHTHEYFAGVKQCLKHQQQLVQTTTILDLSVKLTCCSTSSTKVIDSHNTNARQQTNVVPSVERIDVYHSFLTQSLPREPNKNCYSTILASKCAK